MMRHSLLLTHSQPVFCGIPTMYPLYPRILKYSTHCKTLQSSLYDDLDIFPSYNSHNASIVGSAAYKGIAAAGLRFFKLFQLHKTDKLGGEPVIAPGKCLMLTSPLVSFHHRMMTQLPFLLQVDLLDHPHTIVWVAGPHRSTAVCCCTDQAGSMPPSDHSCLDALLKHSVFDTPNACIPHANTHPMRPSCPADTPPVPTDLPCINPRLMRFECSTI